MDAWNVKDGQAMADLFTADGVYEDLAFQTRFVGAEQVARWVGITADHIPDLRNRIDDAFRDGDRIGVRWTMSGTPRMLGAVKGTGAGFELPVLSILALEGDRIARATDCYNLADLLRQIGLPAGPYAPRAG